MTLTLAIAVSLLVSLTHDADDVRAVPAARVTRAATAGSTALSERVFDGILGFYARTLGWVLRHQLADRCWSRSPRSASTSTSSSSCPRGSSRSRTPGGSSAASRPSRTSRSWPCATKMSEFADVVDGRPGGQQRGRLSRAAAARRHATPAACSSRSSRWPSARSRADQVIDAAARQARPRPRRHAVPAGRAGPPHRRARQQRAVPVHAAEREPGRAQRVRAAHAGQAARRCPGCATWRPTSRTAACRPRSSIDRDAASRLGIQRAGHRRRRSTTPSASARSRRSTRRSTSTTSCWRSRPQLPAEPGRAEDDLREVARRARQVPLSAIARFAPSTTPLAVNHQGQFPSVTLSFNLAPGRGARRRRRRDPGGRARRSACRRRSARASRARPRPSRPRSPNQPLLILAALVAVYIVLGVLYESYIHPITILSTLPSAGVGAILALLLFGDRAERHRADRHHPADRHREEERDHDDRLRARRGAHAAASRRPRRSTRRACSASGRS